MVQVVLLCLDILNAHDRLWRSGAGLQRLRARSDCLVNAAVQWMLDVGVDHSVLLENIAGLNQTFQYAPSREVATKLFATFKANPAALLSPLLEEAPHSRLESLAYVWHTEFPDIPGTALMQPGVSYANALAGALLDDPQILTGGPAECMPFFRELLVAPGPAQAAGTDAAWRTTASRLFNFCMLRTLGTGLSDVSRTQLVSRVILLDLVSTYKGVKGPAEMYELTIATAAATQ
ncbi:hypothetical protein FOA52_009746 [Chlamydomonas sp. UWO 241]|nr:hypothetical protein FOA52_009746 [Chlamydomonas sp. UWO 241]